VTARSPLALGLAIFEPPERVAAAAAAAEEAGFDEVWLGEDFFDGGGIAGAALALGATTRVIVGLGVLSAPVREPAMLAMELATLGRAHPGRLVAGIGLGDPGPLGVIGRMPASPLGAIRETVTAVRALLRGEVVMGPGGAFALAHPAAVPIHVGAMGPRALRLAGEVGEGTVLSTGAGPAYVEWACRRIAEGRGGDLTGHRVTALAFISVGATTGAGRDGIRAPLAGLLARPVFGPMLRYSGLGEEAQAAVAGGADALDRALGPGWVEAFAVVGDPPACVAKIQALHLAGAGAVVLCPWGEAPNCSGLAVDEVLPALRRLS
jgi:alkanesulfonate monooxygenase SsuD/methylene tetrahydromethanopterin reductase-like flavin-dependent oxidoreductase (luciferase family)